MVLVKFKIPEALLAYKYQFERQKPTRASEGFLMLVGRARFELTIN